MTKRLLNVECTSCFWGKHAVNDTRAAPKCWCRCHLAAFPQVAKRTYKVREKMKRKERVRACST